jgi:ferredoxin-nitrite reductase
VAVSGACWTEADHLKAMARFEAQGKKLSPEEKAKRDEHPFDAYARLKAESAKGQFPKGADNFRWRYHGLFYVAPAQNSYMCRLRMPNGILAHWQLAAVADIAERYCNGYAHITTRANLQVREIAAQNATPVLEGLADIGLVAKGSGADNIRNVTGSPRPASTRRSCSIRGPTRAPGTTISSTTARSTACRGNSTSASTAAA